MNEASQEAGAAAAQVTTAAADLSQRSETLREAVSQVLHGLRHGAADRDQNQGSADDGDADVTEAEAGAADSRDPAP